MARAKSKQTIVERQHRQLLKKKGIKIADWEEETFKTAIGDLASRQPDVYEDILEIYRKKEVDESFEMFLKEKINNEDKKSDQVTKVEQDKFK